jgi:hypothetical protein
VPKTKVESSIELPDLKFGKFSVPPIDAAEIVGKPQEANATAVVVCESRQEVSPSKPSGPENEASFTELVSGLVQFAKGLAVFSIGPAIIITVYEGAGASFWEILTGLPFVYAFVFLWIASVLSAIFVVFLFTYMAAAVAFGTK